MDVQTMDSWLVDRRYTEVIIECDALLADTSASVEEQGRACQYKAVALRRLGPAWAGAAVSALNDGLDRLQDARPDLRARLLVDLLAVYSGIPDPEVCHGLLRQYVALCEECPEARQWRWHAYQNCGVSAISAGALQAAGDAFQRAADVAETNVQRAIAQHNLAHTCVRLGRLADAALLLESSEADLPDEYAALAANTRARYHLAQGDLGAAERTINSELCAAVDTSARAEITLTAALIARARGDRGEARRFALDALTLAYQVVNHGVLHEAHTFIKEA